MTPDSERRARVGLSFVAQPGDPVVGSALRTRSAAELLALVAGADADGEAILAEEAEDGRLARVPHRKSWGEIECKVGSWQVGANRRRA
jgi:hypothetical protein